MTVMEVVRVRHPAATQAATRPVWISESGRVLRKCGYAIDCPRNYTLSAVNRSAASWVPGDAVAAARLLLRHKDAGTRCAHKDAGRKEGRLESGGWCLERKGARRVELPHNQSYELRGAIDSNRQPPPCPQLR